MFESVTMVRLRLRNSLPILGLVLVLSGSDPARAQSDASWEEDVGRIVGHARTGNHRALVDSIERFFDRHAVDDRSWPLLLLRAESLYQLGEDGALDTLLEVLPFVEAHHSVGQRELAMVNFRIGAIYARRHEWPEAIAATERGLRLEPGNMVEQIRLGELLLSASQRPEAIRHFRGLRDTVPPHSEPAAVLDIKLGRLGDAGPASASAELHPDTRFPGLRITLVPVGAQDRRLAIEDACLLVETRWRIACVVLPPIEIASEGFFDPARNQASGDALLRELQRRYPASDRPGDLLVALTGHDLFGPDTNFVFSWQRPRDRIAILSSFRFLAPLEEFYEPQVVATRRLAIQLLSTTSSLLGLARATRADCPTAFPNDLEEFLLKGSRLCDSEISQRDEVLGRLGGRPEPVGDERLREIARVEAVYRFE